MGLLVAGTKYRGEFEERLKKLMDEIKQNDDIILVSWYLGYSRCMHTSMHGSVMPFMPASSMSGCQQQVAMWGWAMHMRVRLGRDQQCMR